MIADLIQQGLLPSIFKEALKEAAKAVGLSTEDFGTHSSCFGGASALWAAYHDTGLAKRLATS